MSSEKTNSVHSQQLHDLWQQGYKKYGIADFSIPDGINNLIDLLKPSIDENSEKVAVSMGDAELNYEQLERSSLQFASFLQTQSYVKGTRVAIQLPNILQYMPLVLGTLRAGMILVNVNPMYTSHELAHQIEDSGAEVLIIFDVMKQAYEGLSNEVKSQIKQVIVCSMSPVVGMESIGSDLSQLMSQPDLSSEKSTIEKTSVLADKHVHLVQILASHNANEFQTVDIGLEDVAVLQYTGGTTGRSKGAMLSHKNLLANTLQSYDFFGEQIIAKVDGQIKMFNPLPLYHIFSFTVCGLLSIYGGWEDILITNPRDMDGLVDCFAHKKPHVIPSVNTLFAGMLAHPKFKTLDFNLHYAIGGGTAIIAEIAKQWHEVTDIPINEGYGMSETSPVITFNPMGIEKFLGNVGLPMAGTDIIILDGEDNHCALGEAGEVCVRGPQVMQGYWQRDNTEVFATIDGENYFRTGDIGHFTEAGHLKLVDRKKDMILVSGFNVYPNEIEAAITEHPKVFEVGVIGVSNEKSGEVPKAFVVKSDESLTEEELVNFIRDRLTGYKRPQEYQFIAELPKSAVGKILRKELRNM